MKKKTTPFTGGFVRNFRCLGTLVDQEILDGIELSIYQTLALWADYETGVVHGMSARRLADFYGPRMKLRTLQEALGKLRRLGLISYDASGKGGAAYSVFVVGYPIASKDTFVMSNPLESKVYKTITEEEFSAFRWLKSLRARSVQEPCEVRARSVQEPCETGTTQVPDKSVACEVFDDEVRARSVQEPCEVRARSVQEPCETPLPLNNVEEERRKKGITLEPENQDKSQSKSAFKAPLVVEEVLGVEAGGNPEDENDKGKHAPGQAVKLASPFPNRRRSTPGPSIQKMTPSPARQKAQPVPESSPTPTEMEDSEQETDPLSAEGLLHTFCQKFPFRKNLGGIPPSVQISAMKRLMERAPAEELATLFDWLFVTQADNVNWQNKLRNWQKPIHVFLSALDDIRYDYGLETGSLKTQKELEDEFLARTYPDVDPWMRRNVHKFRSGVAASPQMQALLKTQEEIRLQQVAAQEEYERGAPGRERAARVLAEREEILAPALKLIKKKKKAYWNAFIEVFFTKPTSADRLEKGKREIYLRELAEHFASQEVADVKALRDGWDAQVQKSQESAEAFLNQSILDLEATLTLLNDPLLPEFAVAERPKFEDCVAAVEKLRLN